MLSHARDKLPRGDRLMPTSLGDAHGSYADEPEIPMSSEPGLSESLKRYLESREKPSASFEERDEISGDETEQAPFEAAGAYDRRNGAVRPGQAAGSLWEPVERRKVDILKPVEQRVYPDPDTHLGSEDSQIYGQDARVVVVPEIRSRYLKAIKTDRGVQGLLKETRLDGVRDTTLSTPKIRYALNFSEGVRVRQQLVNMEPLVALAREVGALTSNNDDEYLKTNDAHARRLLDIQGRSSNAWAFADPNDPTTWNPIHRTERRLPTRAPSYESETTDRDSSESEEDAPSKKNRKRETSAGVSFREPVQLSFPPGGIQVPKSIEARNKELLNSYRHGQEAQGYAAWVDSPEVSGIIQLDPRLVVGMNRSLEALRTNQPHMVDITVDELVSDDSARTQFATLIAAILNINKFNRGNQSSLERVYDTNVIDQRSAIDWFRDKVYNPATRHFDRRVLFDRIGRPNEENERLRLTALRNLDRNLAAFVSSGLRYLD